jgi:hypothetical protein
LRELRLPSDASMQPDITVYFVICTVATARNITRELEMVQGPATPCQQGGQGNTYIVRDILTKVLHVSFKASLFSHGEKSAVDNILRLETLAHQLAQDPGSFQISCYAEPGSNGESNSR